MNSMDSSEYTGVDLAGTGKITVIMVMNLGRFMAEDDWESRNLFRELRGSPVYAQYLREMKAPPLFTKLDNQVMGGDPWVEAQGYEIGVFHRHLLENWFFPTYELNKSAALSKIKPEFSKSPLFQKEWNRWDHYKIRFTRNGSIQVKLTRKFTQERLYDLATQLLESERDEFRLRLLEVIDDLQEKSRDEIRRVWPHTLRWQLAHQVIELFISQLKEIRIDDARVVIPLKMPDDERKTPIRDQYTVIFFREILHQHESRIKKLTGDEILKNKTYASIIHTLWTGTLIGDRLKKTIKFPEYLDKEINRLSQENLSTFAGEICLMGSERALIHCPFAEHAIYLPYKGSKTHDGIRYNDYWKCIIRGVEHILTLRPELQMVEAYTNHEMNRISKYTHDLTTQGISRKEKREIERLAKRVSKLFNLLNSIRDVIVAPSSYRASYAIEKFDRIAKILGLPQIQSHVEKNIEQLNFFISHCNNLIIQQNGDRLQRLAFIFAAGVGFLGLASLLKDTHELNEFLHPASWGAAFISLWHLITHMPTLVWLILGWTVIVAIFYSLWKLYIYFAE